VGAPFVAYVKFPLCISCIWHGICNMMYRHPCILDCMHFVSYALDRKSFSYIHCSPWNAIVWYAIVSLAWLLLILMNKPWLMAMFLKNITYMLSRV
jgi:hypothetical protein